MKVEVKQLRLVAYWTWGCNDENCGICRNPFDACCPDCKTPGDDCTISELDFLRRVACGLGRGSGSDQAELVWGQCSHSFHLHCILKWLEAQMTGRQQCPMCRAEWKFRD